MAPRPYRGNRAARRPKVGARPAAVFSGDELRVRRHGDQRAVGVLVSSRSERVVTGTASLVILPPSTGMPPSGAVMNSLHDLTWPSVQAPSFDSFALAMTVK